MPVNEPAGRNIIRADRTLRTVTLIGVAVVLLVVVIALVYTGSFLHDIQVLAQEAPIEGAAKVGLRQAMKPEWFREGERRLSGSRGRRHS